MEPNLYRLVDPSGEEISSNSCWNVTFNHQQSSDYLLIGLNELLPTLLRKKKHILETSKTHTHTHKV